MILPIDQLELDTFDKPPTWDNLSVFYKNRDEWEYFRVVITKISNDSKQKLNICANWPQEKFLLHIPNSRLESFLDVARQIEDQRYQNPETINETALVCTAQYLGDQTLNKHFKVQLVVAKYSVLQRVYRINLGF